MSAPGGRTSPSIQISDLYLLDPAGKTSAVAYPGWSLPLLIVTGIVAFAATGFLGYPTDAGPLYTLFHPAWLLFLWFSAMILIMQASIFRHREARRWKWETLSVTLVCIAIVAGAYTRPDLLNQMLKQLAILLGVQGEQGRVLWNLANFGIIALYLIDRSVLWIRHQRTKHMNIFVELGAFGLRQSESDRPVPTSWELLSQDLFAGAALCVLLGVLFQTTVINVLTQWVAGVHADTCTVAWVFGACHVGSPQNPPTLGFIDLSLALFAIAASALMLGAVLLASTFVRREATEVVARGVGEILLAVLNPLDVLIRNLRNVLWPGLILAGTICAATSSRYFRLYLHAMSDVQTCGQAARCPDLREFGLYVSNSLDAQRFQTQAPGLEVLFLTLALLGVVGATLAIVTSARVLLLEWHIRGRLAANWLRFVRSIAHKLLLAFWILSLGLSALMVALQHVNLTDRAPFPQPGKSTAISFIYFLASLAVILYRRATKRRQSAPLPVASQRRTVVDE
ncbi:MAG TPA: hypothetical protein VJQ45_09515 [Ktedonobacterales bacterium]|nr:hypothetical protein [Ktedonobacterales bacterium]